MHFASLALGFGLGVLSAGLITVVLACVAALAWARGCKAFEKAGYELTVKSPE